MFLIAALNVTLFGCFIPETKDSPMTDRMPSKTEKIWRREKPSLMVLSPTTAKLTEDV
jgi:ABC-type uncharacterized transport system auxiliary subunit